MPWDNRQEKNAKTPEKTNSSRGGKHFVTYFLNLSLGIPENASFLGFS
jgi:hypothetical protein